MRTPGKFKCDFELHSSFIRLLVVALFMSREKCVDGLHKHFELMHLNFKVPFKCVN